MKEFITYHVNFDVILVDIADTPYQIPHDMNACVYLVKWPITFLLWITLPDCRKHPALKMITFFICIIWIGVASYAVAMIITIIGECVNIYTSFIYFVGTIGRFLNLSM